jgi:hypothetical protein
MQVYLAAEQALAAAEQGLAVPMRYESGVGEKMIFLSANTDDSRSAWVDNLITGCDGEWWRNKICRIRWLSSCPRTHLLTLLCIHSATFVTLT